MSRIAITNDFQPCGIRRLDIESVDVDVADVGDVADVAEIEIRKTTTIQWSLT